MKTWLLAAAAALAMVGAAHAAGEKAIKDWAAVCSNLGDCTAFGFSPEGDDTGAYIMIRREAGPAAQPAVTIVYGAGDTQPAQTWILALDGKPIAALGPLHAAGGQNGARAVLTGAAAAHVIETLRNGQALELTAGGKTLESVSLSGSAATLLWVDDQQGRVGTVTALTKNGAAPAVSVHPRLAPPLVTGAAPVSQAGLPKHAPPSLIKTDPDCDLDPDVAKDPADVVARLAPGVVLWGPQCSSGAYNEVNIFFIGDERAGHLRRVKFPYPPGTPSTAGNDDILFNVQFDPKTQTLTSFDKARGPADCGENDAWVWDGKAFQLAHQYALATCRGASPDDWPPVFVSRQK